MTRTGPFKFAVLITLIMGIALGFLYLLERQNIYNSIKENSRNLVHQEASYHEQLGHEWDKSLKRLMNHNNLRLYLNAYAKTPDNIPRVYIEALNKVFLEITTYRSNMVERITLISLEGQELIAAEKDSVATNLINWYENDYFRDAISKPSGKIGSNQFHKKGTEAYLYKSVPLAVNDKKIALLTFTISMRDIIDKYQYLLAATINDQIVAMNKQGKFLIAHDPDSIDKEELSKVIVAIKQKSSGDPIMEYRDDVWSFIKNDEQEYYILFESKGEKITRLLNEEYVKLGTVFFVSSFIMIILVFFSTRRFQREQAKVKSDKVINTQRSHNFASISDEIRQPLNSLMGALVTLEEIEPEKKNNPYLDSAKKTAIHISELINEFSDFAKINEGRFQLEPIEFDFRTTLNDIADLMSVQAADKGLDISCLVSSDMPQRIKGDATRMRQVLINLISFAIKYTDHGEISLCLSADEYSETEKMIHIDVSDTGNIIDQQSMLEHFKMFTNPEYFADEANVGEGLGLALSNHLVNLMRGNISVKENASGGNTFRVSVPMPVFEALSVSVPKDNLKGKRVLIIGEIEDNRQMLSHALSKWGMSGGTMDDFNHVVEVLNDASNNGKGYHACLIDVSLSSRSEKAFKLVYKIREKYDADALGIIILTVQGAPGDAKLAQESGAQAFLTKPMTRKGMKEVLLRIFDSNIEKRNEFITRHMIKEQEQESLVRILVGDANEDLHKQMVRYFDSSHYKVDFAKDAQSFEAAINHNVYDMVLVDTSLPKLDVFSYVKKFRAYEKNLNTALNVSSAKLIRLPIVAMVPEITSNLTERCETYGLDNLISKPINKEQIEDMVSYYLSENKE